MALRLCLGPTFVHIDGWGDKMRKRTRLWLVLFMVVGMALGSAGIASAQTNPFPTTKEPGSAQFDISGSYFSFLVGGSQTSGGMIDFRISGGGAVSGKNMQLDMTLTRIVPETAGDPPDPNDPNAVRISMILLDGKLYFKLPGFTGEDNWIVTDAGELTTGSLTGSMTGMGGFDPRYTNAFTVTQEGKETLNGAPTTKYRIDVDYEKLLSAMGSQLDTSVPPGSVSDIQYVMYMWVGDNDMYLHQMNMSLDGTLPIADATLNVNFDFTITFRDFDQPVTITAPPNAEELDLSSLGIDPSMIPGGVLGMPGVVATGMPGIGTGMAGMPRTGAPSGSFPFVPVAVAVLGLLCLALGGIARRISFTNAIR